jgi:hypothetical protein
MRTAAAAAAAALTVLTLASTPAMAFVPRSPLAALGSPARSRTSVASTVEEAPAASSSSSSSASPLAGTPLAEAPDVGALPDCPATIWDAQFDDVAAAQQAARDGTQQVDCPKLWEADADANGAGPSYFSENKDEIMATLQEHGCIWFRGFDLMKEPEGFRAFYDALDLPLCLDPIHSSGLRKMISAKDGIYEEVNKPTLRGHYIGLHQESTHVKTSTYGAFVCFQEATVSGGEFLVADAARILADMDPKVLQRIYDNKVRISVSNLDFDFLGATGPLVKPLMSKAKDLISSTVAPKFDMELEMLYGSDGKPFRLQAVEPPMTPINRHPKTGLPLWFCNIHNHARYLRDNRPCTVPEVGMTDVYYGDLSAIPAEDLEHIDEVSRKHIVSLPMKPGDVVFVDNYRMLHGRDVFEGDRAHAVAWFGEQKEGSDRDAKLDTNTANVFNKMLNNYVENAF